MQPDFVVFRRPTTSPQLRNAFSLSPDVSEIKLDVLGLKRAVVELTSIESAPKPNSKAIPAMHH